MSLQFQPQSSSRTGRKNCDITYNNISYARHSSSTAIKIGEMIRILKHGFTFNSILIYAYRDLKNVSRFVFMLSRKKTNEKDEKKKGEQIIKTESEKCYNFN